MSVPYLNCIPDFAQSIPPEFQTFVPILKCCPPTGDQLYSILYALGQSFFLVTSGTFGPVEKELESTFTRFAIVITAPWVLVFIALFVLLMAQRTISVAAGVFFIVLSIILAVLAVVWTLHDVSVTTTALSNAFRTKITENFNQYQSDIVAHVAGAYLLSESCNTNEPNSCCGFNRSGCVSGCNTIFQVEPSSIPSASSGSIEIAVISDLDISGTITIPPEIIGGDAPKVINFTGLFDTTVTYNTTATPGVYYVDFISKIGSTGSYSSSPFPVTVYDKNSPPTLSNALTNVQGLGAIDTSQLSERALNILKKSKRCRTCK